MPKDDSRFLGYFPLLFFSSSPYEKTVMLKMTKSLIPVTKTTATHTYVTRILHNENVTTWPDCEGERERETKLKKWKHFSFSVTMFATASIKHLKKSLKITTTTSMKKSN